MFYTLIMSRVMEEWQMVTKRVLSSTVLCTLLALGLSACDKKKSPIADEGSSATTAASKEATAAGTKTENDLYIERLNKDVKVDNPDALLDEVNKDTQHK